MIDRFFIVLSGKFVVFQLADQANSKVLPSPDVAGLNEHAKTVRPADVWMCACRVCAYDAYHQVHIRQVLPLEAVLIAKPFLGSPIHIFEARLSAPAPHATRTHTLVLRCIGTRRPRSRAHAHSR